MSRHRATETWLQRVNRVIRELCGPERHYGRHHPDFMPIYTFQITATNTMAAGGRLRAGEVNYFDATKAAHDAHLRATEAQRRAERAMDRAEQAQS